MGTPISHPAARAPTHTWYPLQTPPYPLGAPQGAPRGLQGIPGVGGRSSRRAGVWGGRNRGASEEP
eukprot:1940544-Alexandrium_andersonii.AAC.1